MQFHQVDMIQMRRNVRWIRLINSLASLDHNIKFLGCKPLLFVYDTAYKKGFVIIFA